MSTTEILGVLATIVATLLATGKLDLKYLLSFLQKKTEPSAVVINAEVWSPSKDDACRAVITLMQYSLATGGDMEALTVLGRQIVKGETDEV